MSLGSGCESDLLPAPAPPPSPCTFAHPAPVPPSLQPPGPPWLVSARTHLYAAAGHSITALRSELLPSGHCCLCARPGRIPLCGAGRPRRSPQHQQQRAVPPVAAAARALGSCGGHHRLLVSARPAHTGFDSTGNWILYDSETAVCSGGQSFA